MNIVPVVLEGPHVRLEPLSMAHVPHLCAVGLDPELWRWTPSSVTTPAEMQVYVQTALQMQSNGSALPFAIIERSSGTVVGSTRFGSIEKNHRRVEIGWTWIARPWQRTILNTEAKYLMLKHAFEVLGCMRVELKTDSLNERSRAAILRIGAKEEGILRNHMVTQSGRVRHTVYYSIIDAEWPVVKAALERKLAQTRGE
jgi:N-acetyltransferase